MTIRPARADDCRRIWEWRNEPAARAASFNSDEIPFDDHERWFTRTLADPDVRVLIVLDDAANPFGFARFRAAGAASEISVGIDPVRRRSGFGAAAIRAASDWVLEQGTASHVIARVKPDNAASLKAFRRAGYEVIARVAVGDSEAYEMAYPAGAVRP